MDTIDLDADPPVREPATAAGPGRRRAPRWPVVALVAVALVVGVLGGSTSTRQLLASQTDAGARVVLAIGVDESALAGVLPAASQDVDNLILVAVSLAGRVDGASEAVVESVRTPLGDFALYPPVRLAAGAKGERTLLRGRIDCGRVDLNREPNGLLLQGSVAQVRPAGARRPAEVDVLVANPSVEITAVRQQCVARDLPQEGMYALEVTRMAARGDGSVVFTVAATSSRPTSFALVTVDRAAAGNPYVPLPQRWTGGDSASFAVPGTGWTITSTPVLPLNVVASTAVTLTFRYACPAALRGTTAPPLPAFPPEITAGSLGENAGLGARYGPGDPFVLDYGVPGWDDAVVRAAATAAALTGCARP